MTLLNVLLEDSVAYVASNTEHVCADGSYLNSSKLLVLPHAGLVFASRGDRRELVMFFNAFALANNEFDFDDVEQSAEEILRRNRLASMAEPEALQPTDTQIAVIGWSPRQMRMSCLWCEHTASGEIAIRRREGVLTPWVSEMGQPPACEPGTDPRAYLRMLSERQSTFLGRSRGGGGNLLIAELTKDILAIRSAREMG